MDSALHDGRTGPPVYIGPSSGSGGHGAGMSGNVDILSDTQGVDFSDYIRRLLATLQRNWYAVMPESVRMGEQGWSTPPPDQSGRQRFRV